ncbi:YqaA family protein [Pseudomonas sp. S9]|uniref:YqaA family protein n=1 Tax=Pseudomonas sp. S9 TaxID=686578 RepID=UPI00025575CF|nr:YqaA family protein [Pseudomonas sp. S9]
MLTLSVYLGLFLSALGAATLLPLQSEALLVGLLLSHDYSTGLLLLAASGGNVLGSLINWWLGCYIEHFSKHRWFPVKPQQLERAQDFYARYGRWSLLLSWAPVIGDPLTLVAGIMREPLWRFLLLVTLAKVARYGILAVITLNLG